jgi:crotonobetainyl-CoA:carnitine CoA-transferase CaiB-like acyl-CoA transferase
LLPDLGPEALAGVKVLDLATLFAGPLMATILGDFGAEVLKIEHPRGDPARTHGPSKDGVALWWAQLARNKACISLYLGAPEGAELFKQLVADADVVVENFRPGTLEKWGLGPEVLHAINPGLVIARVTGFGQFGPMSHRAGFGTLAEAMSGFASITGEPDGPPTLPPFGLADGISALTLTNAVLMCLFARDRNRSRGGIGKGQVIDLAIIEPILTVLGAQPIIYDQLGTVQQRTGNRSVNNAPRNTYLTSDGKWVAVSTSANTIAERVMKLVGHPEVIDEPWFSSGAERAKRADLLDEMVSSWISTRPQTEVIAAFEQAEAAIAPVYDVTDVFTDPQFAALDTLTTVHDPVLGDVRMQNVLFRLSATPGRIKWTGRPIGADNSTVFIDQLGLSTEQLDALHTKGVI